MADTDVLTKTACEKTGRPLDDLALSIQASARRISLLEEVISEATDELCRQPSDRRRRAVGMVDDFARMIRELADKIEDEGEEVEVASMKFAKD